MRVESRFSALPADGDKGKGKLARAKQDSILYRLLSAKDRFTAAIVAWGLEVPDVVTEESPRKKTL